MNTAALKTMFWKECRENLRWAVLALLGLSLGLAYAGFRLFQQSIPSLEQVWSSEDLLLTIAAPLIGLALGLLQILPELRRDQWAFLMHRPVSRTTLFWGKVLPGVCLYLAATSLPLLGLAVWAAQPSHVPAPFDFRFTLGGWAAILAGLPFYFAGLLTALRPARWYGSRALPLVTALLAPWAAAELYEFWQVTLSCLLVTAALLCAAWSSFVSGGEYGEQMKPARFALGLALYPAAAAVCAGALMLAAAAYNGLTHPGAQEWWRNEYRINVYGRGSNQGKIYLFAEHQNAQGKDIQTLSDLAGHAMPPGFNDSLSDFISVFLSNVSPEYYLRYSDPSRYVMDLGGSFSDRNQTYWYYAAATRQIVTYSVTDSVPSRHYLGPNGLSQNTKETGKFPFSRPEPTAFAGLHLLRFRQAVYWYDTTTSAVGLLQTMSGGSEGMTLLRATDRENGEVQAMLIADSKQISIYAYKPSKPLTVIVKLFTVAMPAGFGRSANSDLRVAITPDNSRFFFWFANWNSAAPSRLITVAKDGRILKDETLPPPPATGGPTKLPFAQAAPAAILPPIFLTGLLLYGLIGHALGLASAAGFWNSLPGFGPVAVFSALGGLVAAVFAGLVSRRCGDGRRGQIAWALGTFWLGGPGVLLLLALRAWPARIGCPSCGRLRVVNRDKCEHCGATFAPPKRDGTEIFDGEQRKAAQEEPSLLGS